jgi:repressor LexA
MEPDFRAGDFLLVDREAEIQNGDIAVVIVDSEEGTVKIVHYQKDVVVLSSVNPTYPPRICARKDVFFCGRVIELKRKVCKY